MKTNIWLAVRRLIRILGAAGIAELIAILVGDQKLLGLTPVIAALFKFLREQYGGFWQWLPIV